MTDFSVAARARKWCPHGQVERLPEDHTFRFCNECQCIAAAVREALEEAEQIAHAWALDVDHCVAALKIGRETGDLANSFAFVGNEIATVIAALRGGA